MDSTVPYTVAEETIVDDERVLEEEEDNWLDTSWAEPHIPNPCTSTGGEKGRLDKDVDVKMNVLKNIDMELEKEGHTKNSSFGRIQLNDNKAGMSGLDKERINQVIYEASKGSKYFENEKRKEKQLQARIENQREKLHKLSDSQIAQGLLEADKLLAQLESERVLTQTIIHIDMDAFYAAVEERDNPSLKNKPMAVGGQDMLSTSNYIARKYGIRAAMPGFIARKLCSDLIIVPTNFDKYKAVSREFQTIFSLYDPNYCMMSLDEAYLDFTECLKQRTTMNERERTFIIRNRNDTSESCKCDLNERLRDVVLYYCFDSTSVVVDKNELLTAKKICDKISTSVDSDTFPNTDKLKSVCPVCDKLYPSFYVRTFGIDIDEAVTELRSRVEQKTQLTASAGIAPNTMLAKICSDKNKPNGQYRLKSTVEDALEFVRDLPLCKVSGIGKVSEKMLNALGVKTCHDLFEKRAIIYHLYSAISFNYLMKVSQAIGSCTIERDHTRKSMSTERTFRELSSPKEMYNKCMELCEALSTDLTEEDLKGKTVTLKLKTVNFEVKTRAKTLAEYTSDADIINKTASELLKIEINTKLPDILKIRLMGVRMSNLLHKSLLQTSKKQANISGFFRKAESETKITDNLTNNLQLPEDTINTDVVDDEIQHQPCNYVELEPSASTTSQCTEKDNSDQINLVEKNLTKPQEESSHENLYSKDNTSDLMKSTESFVCPICNTKMLSCNLQTFNEHVDVCLNKGAIRELISDINREKSSSVKRKSDSNVSSASVKRKKMNKSDLLRKKGSILDFMKKDKS